MQKLLTYSLFIFLSTTSILAQDNCFDKFRTIDSLLLANHISPKKSDTLFEDLSYDLIEELDPFELYFSNENIDKIESVILSYKNNKINYCRTIDNIHNIYINSLYKGYDILSTLSKSHERLKELIEKKVVFDTSTNDIELEKNWVKVIKNYIFSSAYEDGVRSNSLSDSIIKEKTKKMLSTLECRRASNKDTIITKIKVEDAFLNSFLHLFDPHSTYFNQQASQEYQEDLATDERSYGFEFYKDENDELIISYIHPGSQIWKSNSIHIDDKINTITINNSEKLDLECISTGIIYKKIYDSNVSTITIDVKNQIGEITSITLKKEILENIDNSVQGYFLNNRIGYISIPSFYSSGNYYNPDGLSNDIAKEVLKLKLQGIKGLILDLRNNGGGYINEAIGLAGLFIDVGQLGEYKTRIDSLDFTLKDGKRGTTYKGQLLILINGHSASASEIVATSLQQNNRAIVVGSTSYGKATAQTFSLLKNTDKQMGSIKITGAYIYNSLGKSHQAKGVVPDIELPSYDSLFVNYESEKYNSLVTDSIEKSKYFTPTNKIHNKEKIIALSKERISSKNYFKIFQSITDSIANDTLPDFDLSNWRSFLNRRIENENMLDKVYNSYSSEELNFSVEANPLNPIFTDFEKTNRNQVIKDIKKDIYIEECINIINDMINFDEN